VSPASDDRADGPGGVPGDRPLAVALRRYLVLAGLLLAAAAIASVVGYLRLPPDAHVAVHFTAGRPDRYAGRTFAVLAVPITLLALLTIGAGSVRSAARKGTGAVGVAVLFLATGMVLLGVHAAILSGVWR
jgi:hypothetical protein